MSYSDYFENKVAALVNDSISVVVCTANRLAVTIVEQFTIAKDKVESTLERYDYYKTEMKGSALTIYVYDNKAL